MASVSERGPEENALEVIVQKSVVGFILLQSGQQGENGQQRNGSARFSLASRTSVFHVDSG